MTGPKRNRKQKSLFQNKKMDDNRQKWTKKFKNGEKDIAEDILEVIVDMKRTVKALEDIANLLQAKFLNEKNDTQSKEAESTEKELRKKNHHHILNCMLCSETFKTVFKLEMHIKGNHDEYDTFECETCSKMFVSKFRLEKHKQIHLNVSIKTCHYFKRNKPCPYEILGCKFRYEKENEDKPNEHLDEHVPDSNEIDGKGRNITEEDTIEVGQTAGHTERSKTCLKFLISRFSVSKLSSRS